MNDSEPRCRCGGGICGVTKRGEVRKSLYKCKGCRRRVPWCCGAADNMPDHCDDCWRPVKHVGKKVREEAALICQMAASNRYDVCVDGPEQFARSDSGLRLAAEAIKQMPKRRGLWWINGQWAEAEARLRTGWTP